MYQLFYAFIGLGASVSFKMTVCYFLLHFFFFVWSFLEQAFFYSYHSNQGKQNVFNTGRATGWMKESFTIDINKHEWTDGQTTDRQPERKKPYCHRLRAKIRQACRLESLLKDLSDYVTNINKIHRRGWKSSAPNRHPTPEATLDITDRVKKSLVMV